MVEISKHMFDQTCRDLPCNLVLHPWQENCFKAISYNTQQAFIGSAKFYSFVYLIQIAMRGKKMKKKKEWIKMTEYYVRSTVMGALICATYPSLGCLFRKILGDKINYYMYMQGPCTLNGLFIFMEPPSRRGLVINLFCNLVLEYWLRIWEKRGQLNITKSKQTLVFMLSSSLLFYLMRLEGDKDKRTPLLWLFTPEKVRRETDAKNVCPHNGSCTRYISKGAGIYFAVGAAFTLARVVLPKLGSPLRALSSVRSKHFKMAMFFGSYIGIYRAVVCYLCRKRGYDAAEYALPAGYLAGLSFLFNPKLNFSVASSIGVLKLTSTILYDKKILKNEWHLPEILYSLCQGTLFHARMMHPETCPSYVFRLVDGVSNGCSLRLLENLQKAAKTAIVY